MSETHEVKQQRIEDLKQELTKQMDALKQALLVISPLKHTKHGMHLRIEHSIEIIESGEKNILECIEALTRPYDGIPF